MPLSLGVSLAPLATAEMEVPYPEGMGTGAAQAPPGLVFWKGKGKRIRKGERKGSGVKALLSPLAPALGSCSSSKQEGEATASLYRFEGKVQS